MASITSDQRKTAFSAGAIIAAGCAISMLGFGPRSVIGFFQLPIITITAGDATSSASPSRCRT